MSIPPQLIRVKRKRVEEAPVTFLQFDDVQKRHRSGSNWAYQRRDPSSQSVPQAAAQSDRPIIHTSRPEDASAPASSFAEVHTSLDASVACPNREAGVSVVEPRRFHISRSTLAAAKGPALHGRISKQARSVSTIFVERSRKGRPSKPRTDFATLQIASQDESEAPDPGPAPLDTVERNQPKRPGVASKARELCQDAPAHAPLPPSLMNRHTEYMDKIASDMNQWVLKELGANLHSMERQKQQVKKPRFKPKAPTQRYMESHPESAPASEPQDIVMGEATEDEGDDDDWIIEEYVRIPANSVALDVSPSDIGVLVLDDDETLLFFGSMHEEDDDLEDDEDENAENHYTADYPEDEVDSDDEYGRQPYCYRNAAASDDEEFDNTICSEGEDNDEISLDGDGDDDEARMARIRAFMQRNSAFR